jgi:HSP20 family molecular chaperone IbpA
VHLCEFSHGHLFRSVHFPRRIDPAKATADYRNGMLRITAPIAEAVQERIDAASER